MSHAIPHMPSGAPRRVTSPRPFSSAGPAPGAAAPVDQRKAAVRIHALFRRLRRAEMRETRGRLWLAKATVSAPLRAAREALRAVRKYGDVMQAEAGVSRPRQFAWMWWLNLRYEYGTHTVYRFRLFSRDRVLPTPQFLQWESAALLFRSINARVAHDAAAVLADKRRFAAWCAEHGIQTPPILMEFEDGRMRRGALREGETPATDLFAKWGTQFGGDATQRWRLDGGRYVDDDARTWSFDEIVATLTERSRQGVVVLQPRLVNHSALRPLSPNALSTIRVMTTRRPGEAPRFLAGILRMGTGNSTADNFAQGGIASAVDAETGVIGEARRIDKQHRLFVYETHPDTGATISGFEVPMWDESVRLALDAHARLGPIACVGWDVAVLEDGPVLLEGNWNPCTKLLQVATETPLLATDFAATYDAWLAQPECAIDDRSLIELSRWAPV